MAGAGAMIAMAPVAGAVGTPRPVDTHSSLMAPYLNGPSRQHVSDIDLGKDRVLVVAQGRNISTAKRASVQEATYADKQQMLTNRGIPLTGITVYDWTQQGPTVVKGNIYATWPQLRTTVDAGGAVTSEGYAHTSLDGMSPTRRWQDTCGVLSDYQAKGHDASSMYSYSGGPYKSSHQNQLVSRCYAFGRQYSSRKNEMRSLADPWVLKVRSINGGCVTKGSSCFGKGGTRGYDSLDNLRSTLVPSAGQASVLQFYHLLVGTGPTWDCTSAKHQTSTTETYCLTDVMSFLDTLPADVKVATTADLAAAVSRSPGQLPGITLEEYLLSQRP